MTTLSPCLPARSLRPSLPYRLIAGLVAASLPLVFILLWSSGYVAGKLALPHTGPMTLLTLRFGLAAVVLLAVAAATGAPWPRRRADWGHLAVVGLLMQVLHFSCIYFALRWGLSAGVAGLLIGLMPLAMALGAHLWLAERIGARQMLGLLGGLAGVGLVIADKPLGGAWTAYAVAGLGLLGLVAGTLYQKRYCAHMDLRSGAGIQMAVSALAVATVAGPLEGFAIDWTPELVGAWLWLGLVNSIGAFSLMFIMIRRGQAGQVARLFFLIPGVSALMGFVLLGERLEPLALAGFALSALAVCFAAAKR
ncbi:MULTISPECIES: DMT family transporter [unclassified Roseateles]|uniref:DMT family transporter n=1 Tax=unclassified Roseateles TaxID=2626991 RepID=UPI000700B3AD|nr:MULTISPECIES: DMT family transporter [unclassified Roseateles]KQW41236.1 drug/metabolite transporter [Pelomonas sp. Root405]KRA68007.1 drug/metabolite transporter [Pelomonas sp. Root662]